MGYQGLCMGTNSSLLEEKCPALHWPRLHTSTCLEDQETKRARVGQQGSQLTGAARTGAAMGLRVTASPQNCTGLRGPTKPREKGIGVRARRVSGVSRSSYSCLYFVLSCPVAIHPYLIP